MSFLREPRVEFILKLVQQLVFSTHPLLGPVGVRAKVQLEVVKPLSGELGALRGGVRRGSALVQKQSRPARAFGCLLVPSGVGPGGWAARDACAALGFPGSESEGRRSLRTGRTHPHRLTPPRTPSEPHWSDGERKGRGGLRLFRIPLRRDLG